MSPTNRDGRRALEADHVYVDELLSAVLAAARANDVPALLATWNAFERHVLVHLNEEEMFILPLVVGENTPQAEWLRAEHNAIRHQVGDTGLAIDLHTVRADRIEQLAVHLREHAQREQAWLYPWAEQALDEARMAHITRRLKAGWKRAGHVIRHISDAHESA